MSTSVVHSSLTFLIELLFLNWEFIKCMFWTVFYMVFSPTEKYVRNEIVLITGIQFLDVILIKFWLILIFKKDLQKDWVIRTED